ncbi:hypothetical protein [Streptomyces sp. NPDC046805]|uniref:hypothetical protein n=1 Tax=Streptomyces sp. NPDC046805 TaxID=3155134 RepID=UPI0033FDAB67
MGFDSYHWREYSLPDPQLAEHRARLASGRGGPDDFLALLHGGDPVAVGVAFDQYKEEEALTRFGGSHPYGEHGDAVRDMARQVLAQPPHPAEEEDADDAGLNHASALLVLAHLATGDDSDRIADILRSRPSSAVMGAVGRAAACALMESSDLNDNLVDALSEVLLDEARGMRERLGAFSYVKGERVAGVLARAAHTADEKVQAEAVVILATHHLTTHGNVVEEVTASWSHQPSRLQARILRDLDARCHRSVGDRGA